jgi:hypothetical protein
MLLKQLLEQVEETYFLKFLFFSSFFKKKQEMTNGPRGISNGREAFTDTEIRS